MKIIIPLALVSFLGVIANAQNNSAPAAQPAQNAVTIPLQPAAEPAVTPAPAPAPAAPANQPTLEELRKKHIDTVAELKKKNIDEITALRESLKGKPPVSIRKAIAAKKVEQKAALKELGKANKAEIEQFRKDHPRPAKKETKK
ncbi:MAG: hypothetical protein A2X34_02310 [Elusimicrobia bacterium GWC2_51_8]|nr:MAG: hypothetical protein A2X33_05215 [Elusimicrobia bacterium GWA2_51_34]OGR59670.1 MAG: hypothetical protein A2X34_02310 [Elusimicrobia bacterium GWC2_51_8]OGR87505.1 MAG: hypothetical protein A2021_08910 [Elusimicrobia bacterium GWF2_52_66]HAF95979.1 hypothetical protein [Elusimicrobiota bacterium]HCE97024.1 hypothetical protein [Elusimicrobiota bacterium]